jgi:hypothetical protein
MRIQPITSPLAGRRRQISRKSPLFQAAAHEQPDAPRHCGVFAAFAAAIFAAFPTAMIAPTRPA